MGWVGKEDSVQRERQVAQQWKHSKAHMHKKNTNRGRYVVWDRKRQNRNEQRDKQQSSTTKEASVRLMVFTNNLEKEAE